MAKLVALGDSLTQGFQSFAITHTEHAFPALIARALGTELPSPDFRGKGGLPCSIEWLARRLEERFGANLNGFEWVRAGYAIIDCIDEVEEYWERGRGSRPSADTLFHNLAVWGFQVGDAYNITAAQCAEAIKNSKNNWLRPPSSPRLRTALRVLNPAHRGDREADTQLAIAERIRDQEGIDHLIAWYGANNCLQTVVQLKIRETEKLPPGPMSSYTLWTVDAFRAEYEMLVARLVKLDAKQTYVATVPHVTIPPLTRGVNENKRPLPESSKYFDFYTYMFVRDEDFNTRRHAYITGADAEMIDQRIDAYNDIIREHAQKHRWNVVDTCKMLDELAVRRNHGKPTYKLPPELDGLSIERLEIDSAGKRTQGGLISLDGIHPTNCCYALVAQEFINAIRKHVEIGDVDFAAVRTGDPLVSYPPRTLDDMMGVLSTVERLLGISRLLDDIVAANM